MPTIERQTGWRRPHPLAICQDIDVLLRIKHFDFPLVLPFIQYFQDRTGQQILDCECGWPTVVALLADPPDDSWRITRAKLADCYEVYIDNLG